ncbi:MAG TPA: agmatine deiminase family protein [Myxococcota bacterium]|nr:agmatine deiminase family protein [Myxococcota bacterium]
MTAPGDDESPASQGWRWPAEWEPHAATWLSWPHNLDTWPGCLDAAEAAFAEMVRALHPHEAVRINVGDAALEARARRALEAAGVDAAAGHGVHFHRIPTDDAWVRDHGPLFVVRERDGVRETALLDTGFDAWGGKYPPWDRDAGVPTAVARELGLPCLRVAGVLEGGAIDGNGAGTILTTEQCLLHANRGGIDRAEAEQRLARALGARHVVWLEGGIEGDDTDGHVDDVARFVSPDTVVVEAADDDAHPDAPALRSAEARLRAARDADGRPLRVETLPVPPPVRGPDGAMLPASYANFYLANEVCLVPTFAAPAEDERALATLEALLPGRELVGIDARTLVVGLGAVHCLTQQQPA